jgi:hypothetical protein
MAMTSMPHIQIKWTWLNPRAGNPGTPLGQDETTTWCHFEDWKYRPSPKTLRDPFSFFSFQRFQNASAKVSGGPRSGSICREGLLAMATVIWVLSVRNPAHRNLEQFTNHLHPLTIFFLWGWTNAYSTVNQPTSKNLKELELSSKLNSHWGNSYRH